MGNYGIIVERSVGQIMTPWVMNLVAIRQISKEGNKKTKHANFSKKRTFLTHWYGHMRLRIAGKKCSFFGKFGVLCFLATSVLRLPINRRMKSLYVCSNCACIVRLTSCYDDHVAGHERSTITCDLSIIIYWYTDIDN